MPTSTLEHSTLAFPPELEALPQWVAWQSVPRPGHPKPAKVPVCPRTGLNASPTDRATWGTHAQALDRCARDHLAGVGFVLTPEDPFVGIDLDHCRNPESGLIEDWAATIVVELRTYTEVSPSGTGLHLLLKGKLPPTDRKKGDVEMYDDKRFVTVSGWHVEGTPWAIESRQAELDALHAEVWPDSGKPRAARPPVDPSAQMDDDTLVRLALNARNGEKFGRLFAGNTLGKASPSEADLALCAILAFWTQDPEQIDRLFRRSGLYRTKWDRDDYRERTIERALAGCTAVYAPEQPLYAIPLLGEKPRMVVQTRRSFLAGRSAPSAMIAPSPSAHAEGGVSQQASSSAADSFSVDQVRRVVESHFPGYWLAVDVGLSVCATLLLAKNSNPVAVVYLGGPSAGKTTVVNMFTDHARSYVSDNFTPAAFVSHSANVSRQALSEIDLLPRIKHKVLLTPELAPVFRGKEDELTKRFSILTRVLDGQGLMTDSGTHGQRGYRGDYLFAWLGCTTPFDGKVWKLMAQLGSRMFFLAMNSDEGTEEALLDDYTREPYQDRLEQCRAAVHTYLTRLFDRGGGVRGVSWGADPQPVLLWIVRCARMLAKMRQESPQRAKAVLTNLARGHALVHGRQVVSPADLPIVAQVTGSSMPPGHGQIFTRLVGAKELTVAQVQAALGVQRNTAAAMMRQLHSLGVMKFEERGQGKTGLLRFTPEWSWCNTPEFQEILLTC
jgi:hypothetical protein